MNNVASDEEGLGCSPKTTQRSCCQPAGGNGSLCCPPKGSFWGKGKALIALIIILAAIGVGVHSLVKGAATRTEVANPTPVCSPQGSAGSGQSGASKPGFCPTQSAGASCTNSVEKGTSPQSTASTPSPCCPVQSQCGVAPGQHQRN